MIRVEIVIVGDGERTSDTAVGTLEVWNVSDLADVSDYAIEYRRPGEGYGQRGGVHGHRRADGIIPLLRRAFEALDR